MLSEKTTERLNALLEKITKGPLSGGGDLQRQMFISTVDQIISEEKTESQRRIIALQNELKKVSESLTEIVDHINQVNPEGANEILEKVKYVETVASYNA